MTLEKKMRKRRANKKTDADMDVDADLPKISIKSKAIGKKKDRFKKSRKQLLHQWSNYLEHQYGWQVSLNTDISSWLLIKRDNLLKINFLFAMKTKL